MWLRIVNEKSGAGSNEVSVSFSLGCSSRLKTWKYIVHSKTKICWSTQFERRKMIDQLEPID